MITILLNFNFNINIHCRRCVSITYIVNNFNHHHDDAIERVVEVLKIYRSSFSLISPVISSALHFFFTFVSVSIGDPKGKTARKKDSLVCRLSIINFHTMCMLSRYLEYCRKKYPVLLWMCTFYQFTMRAGNCCTTNFPWACSDDNSSHGNFM